MLSSGSITDSKNFENDNHLNSYRKFIGNESLPLACGNSWMLIALSQGKFTIIDIGDYELASQFNWYYNNGYAVARGPWVKGVRNNYLLHRLINKTPAGLHTDHINHNKIDNRRSNLRTVTTSQNQCNRKPRENCSSIYKGVYWKHNRWQAQIKVSGEKLYLGRFKEEKLAAKAYDEAAIKYFGEYAGLNNV